MRVAGTALAALVLHLLAGWVWTLAAGVLGGAWAVRRGWLVGALGVGLEWAALVAYDFAVAPRPTATLAATVGGLFGNLPAVVPVALTLLVGAALGGVGGLAGTQLALLRGTPAPTDT